MNVHTAAANETIIIDKDFEVPIREAYLLLPVIPQR